MFQETQVETSLALLPSQVNFCASYLTPSDQHDDFIALCSELVTSLLELRRKAEAESAGGVRNSALLDAKHPHWRDELPIYVPAEDEAFVAANDGKFEVEEQSGRAIEVPTIPRRC